MLRALKRFVLTLLAIVFLIEAWLWDHLEPVVERILGSIPWMRLRERIASWIEPLPPWATLFVFVLPSLVLLPLHFVVLWLLIRGYWLLTVIAVVASKLIGLGLAAFIFDVTRPKLLQLAWFRLFYDTVMRWRAWAHALVAPYRERWRVWLETWRVRSRGGWLEMLRRIRRRAGAPRSR